MYEKLSNRIAEVLRPMLGTSIKEIAQFEIQKPLAFPFISIIEDDTSEDEVIFDTRTNIAVYRFKIRVVHSVVDAGGLPECASALRILTDEVLSKIRANKEWADCVLRVDTGVAWGYFNEEFQRHSEISLSFQILVDAI